MTPEELKDYLTREFDYIDGKYVFFAEEILKALGDFPKMLYDKFGWDKDEIVLHSSFDEYKFTKAYSKNIGINYKETIPCPTITISFKNQTIRIFITRGFCPKKNIANFCVNILYNRNYFCFYCLPKSLNKCIFYYLRKYGFLSKTEREALDLLEI
jgi:hypothetical protein